jgi:hypothetical protein
VLGAEQPDALGPELDRVRASAGVSALVRTLSARMPSASFLKSTKRGFSVASIIGSSPA